DLLRSILAALIRREGLFLLLSVLAGFIFSLLPARGAAQTINSWPRLRPFAPSACSSAIAISSLLHLDISRRVNPSERFVYTLVAGFYTGFASSAAPVGTSPL